MADRTGPGAPGGLERPDDVGRVVVLDVVGLTPAHVSAERTPNLAGLLGDAVAPLRPAFPALTVPAQTTLATGRPPADHGDVASGEYDRDVDRVEFWGRERAGRDRLWEAASDDAGLTTGALFFQHLVGTTADVAVTPSPVEDEDGELVEMDCWTNPDGFYDDLREAYGHFPLHNYWGPAASAESSRWILDAAGEAVDRYDPDLLWVYVPHLDYAGLRSGPGSDDLQSAVETVDDLLGGFLSRLRDDGRWPETVANVVSEYGFHAVDAPAFPNRALREAGLLATRPDGEGGLDVDLTGSDAFAMVDHQVAHVYADGSAVDEAKDALAGLAGVDVLLDGQGKAAYGLDHPRAGDLVLVAEPSAWFAYYWWTADDEAPAYATDVDIHRKPGFDPCELFVGERGLVSTDPTLVGGSHGRVDPAASGCYGLGGPAAPAGALDGPVDATAVAPTVASMLGVADDLSPAFEAPSLVPR